MLVYIYYVNFLIGVYRKCFYLFKPGTTFNSMQLYFIDYLHPLCLLELINVFIVIVIV